MATCKRVGVTKRSMYCLAFNAADCFDDIPFLSVSLASCSALSRLSCQRQRLVKNIGVLQIMDVILPFLVNKMKSVAMPNGSHKSLHFLKYFFLSKYQVSQAFLAYVSKLDIVETIC